MGFPNFLRCPISRRDFLGAMAAAVVNGSGPRTRIFGQAPPQGEPPLLILATDLFYPPDDPDDHWDLATAFALAAQNLIRPVAVVFDFPRPDTGKNPDVEALAQMNFLTGSTGPGVVGSKQPYARFLAGERQDRDLAGIYALLRLMEETPRPVVVSVAGSCRNIALAASINPELFRKKCAGVYLNAGTSRPSGPNPPLEWNVTLDPEAYDAMFGLPCPVYWMPCFEDARRFEVSEYATYFHFRQGDVLGRASPRVKNFFTRIFASDQRLAHEGKRGTGWLSWLDAPEDDRLMTAINNMERNMWCTAGFIHAAGYNVTPDGELVRDDGTARGVFKFEPVQIELGENHQPRWHLAAGDPWRLIFHVIDLERYSEAMTRALANLLSRLS